MNAFLVFGTLFGCALIFTLVIGGITALGVPVPLALVLVYVSVVLWMRGMQRRAGSACDPHERRGTCDRSAADGSSTDGSFTREQRPGLGHLLHQP